MHRRVPRVTTRCRLVLETGRSTDPNMCSTLGLMVTWRDAEARAIWVLRPGVTPLPAWPGLLLAWRRTDGEPPAPPRWQALVAYSRAGQIIELAWLYDSQIRPISEEPPVCGGK